MNLRRLATAVAAAALLLSPLPAQAAPEGSPPTPQADTVEQPPELIVPDETTPKANLRRDTDTLSLYKQAGLQPGKRVLNMIEDPTAPKVASYTEEGPARDSAGNIVPIGLSEHVDQFCSGTGTDGPRVQVMYLREVDQPDRYAQVAPIIRNEMRYIDDAFAVSSKETGGGRRVRWAHDAACNLSVTNVVLPDGAITGTWEKTNTALQQAGYNLSNRKYLTFADVNIGGLSGGACGQGALYLDPSPTNNVNDGRYAQMARVDLGCWVTTEGYHAAPLHELLHTLGAVMPTAPHSTPGMHCTDGAEVMCYNDGTAVVDYDVCAGQQHDIDCNNDDYFNTNPAPGSYLATHWNTANSPFLAAVPELPDAPTLSVKASTTTPVAGDVVTFTATTSPGAQVRWSTNTPTCEIGTVATTGNTFSIQCHEAAMPTVTALAYHSGGYTSTTVNTRIEYQHGMDPTLEMTGPGTANVDQEFAVSAKVVNTKAAWTYKWTLTSNPGCTIRGATSPTAYVTRGAAAVNGRARLYASATRTVDGVEIGDTVWVDVKGASVPVVTITGPTTVKAGEVGTFAATAKSTLPVTYQWYSDHNWGSGTASTFSLRVPANATDGTDTLYLTVTNSNGERTSATFTYSVLGSDLAMTMAGPATLVSGATGTYTATPTKPATITWSSNEPDCSIVKDSSTPNKARLTCTEDFDGFVTVTAIASSGTATARSNKIVTVTPESAEQTKSDTTIGLSATKSGKQTRLSISLQEHQTGAALANTPVTVQFRPINGQYSNLQQVTLDRNGLATVNRTLTSGGYFRVVYAGSDTHEPSVSTERRAYAFTSLANQATRTGLKAILRLGNGAAISAVKVTLQQRVAGSRRWVKVRVFKTNKWGAVEFKVNPRKKTQYRWVYAGDSSRYAATSRAVTKP